MNSLTKKLVTVEDMEREAYAFTEALERESSGTGATLITLSGELGAGKTAFAQFVAKALGITDIVNSPTYVIEKIYRVPEGGLFTRLVHIDAYRLEGAEDLTMLGFGEIMSHASTLVLLEWPERVKGIAEQASIKILLEVLPDDSRQITYA